MSKAMVNEINSLVSQLNTKIFVVARPVTENDYYSPLEKEVVPLTKVSTKEADWISNLRTGLVESQPLLIDYSDEICNLLVKDQKHFYLVYPTHRFVYTEMVEELHQEANQLIANLDAVNVKTVTKLRLHAHTTFIDTLRLALETQKRESQPAPSSNEDTNKGSC